MDILLQVPYFDPMTIREFVPGDEDAFRSLNEEWINRYFEMEEKDRASLNDPYASILNKGGRIFFAVRDSQAVGCCALLAMPVGGFEVAKMAVTESAQGHGIGRRLLEAVVDAARESGTKRLYLETNSKLQTAIHLYHSVGFRPVPADRAVPSPYSRSDTQLEMFL